MKVSSEKGLMLTYAFMVTDYPGRFCCRSLGKWPQAVICKLPRVSKTQFYPEPDGDVPSLLILLPQCLGNLEEIVCPSDPPVTLTICQAHQWQMKASQDCWRGVTKGLLSFTLFKQLRYNFHSSFYFTVTHPEKTWGGVDVLEYLPLSWLCKILGSGNT